MIRGNAKFSLFILQKVDGSNDSVNCVPLMVE